VRGVVAADDPRIDVTTLWHHVDAASGNEFFKSVCGAVQIDGSFDPMDMCFHIDPPKDLAEVIDWLGQLVAVFQIGNSGQKRLSVVRCTHVAISEVASPEFRRKSALTFRRLRRAESQPTVISTLDWGINSIESIMGESEVVK
jgi:hypothetical protein